MSEQPTPELPEDVDLWDSAEGDQVRAERDSLLADSDYAVLPDSPAQRAMDTRVAVWAYRQALRDIPQVYEDPSEVVFPEIPEAL
tara:strand:- start:13429 stop:13683 length:255 start_codon:yes stop_codon:yes gene_type:complete